jgi:hypothetical protein
MAVQNTVMLIADIGGYTRFMKIHRMNLAHAQQTVALLLEAVIDSAAPFALSKLEGDAAFFHTDARRLEKLGSSVQAIRAGFLQRRQRLILDRMCTCEGCMQIEQLTLKFVVHAGEVAFQKVKRHIELAGFDVIVLHRMLKNDVPLSEYVLTTDAGLSGFSEELRALAQPLEHNFEGVGPTQTHYIDLAALPPPPVTSPSKSWSRKLWNKLLLETRTLPYLVGLKTPCDRFDETESQNPNR